MKAASSTGTRRKTAVKRKKAAAHAAKRTHGRAAPRRSGAQGTQATRNEFSEDEWRDMVATAAYFRAQSRGFDGASSDEDWYEAEAELRERFSVGNDPVEAHATAADEGAGNDWSRSDDEPVVDTRLPVREKQRK